MRAFSVGLTVVLLAACGDVKDSSDDEDAGIDEGGAPAPFASGDRLKPIYMDGGEGAVHLRWWYDAELEIECRFRTATDGQWRCVPVSGGARVYADAGCSEPLLEAPFCGGEPPAYVVPDGLRDCATGTEVMEVGASTERSTFYFLDQAGDCVSRDLSEPATYYALTPVDPTMLAGATERAVELDSGLGALLLETEGGAHELVSAWSVEHEAACGHLELDGEDYCAHGTTAFDFARYYAADTCEGETIAYTTGGPACDPPAVIPQSRPDENGCYRVTGLFEVAGSVDPTDVYEGSPGSCNPARDTGGYHQYWELGGQIQDIGLPTLSSTWVGEGRVRALYRATPEGTPLGSATGWRDHERDARCYELEGPSGTIRCVPELAYSGSGIAPYADAACTEPLVTVSVSTGCGTTGEVPAYYVERTDLEPCMPPEVVDIFEVGAEHTGPIYRADDNLPCEPTERGEDVTYYAVGSESVSLDEYPEIATVNEP